MNSLLSVVQRWSRRLMCRRTLFVLAAVYFSTYVVARIAGIFLYYSGTLLMGQFHGGVFHVWDWRPTIWQPVAFIETASWRLVKIHPAFYDPLGNEIICGKMNAGHFAKFSGSVPAHFTPIAGRYFNREDFDKERYSVVYAVPPETSLKDLERLANRMMGREPDESASAAAWQKRSASVGEFVFGSELPRASQGDAVKGIRSVDFVLDPQHHRVLMVWEVDN